MRRSAPRGITISNSGKPRQTDDAEALASFVGSGGTSPGVLLVIPQNAPIREVVETLILIWADDRSTTGTICLSRSRFSRRRGGSACRPGGSCYSEPEKNASPVGGGDKQSELSVSLHNGDGARTQRIASWSPMPGKKGINIISDAIAEVVADDVYAIQPDNQRIAFAGG